VEQRSQTAHSHARCEGINIDTGAPAVTVNGVRSGAVYPGSALAARCAARDTVSGIVSCQLTIARRGTTVQYSATEYDRSGNHAGVHGSYPILNFYVHAAHYRAGAFDVAICAITAHLAAHGRVCAAGAASTPRADGSAVNPSPGRLIGQTPTTSSRTSAGMSVSPAPSSGRP
jgi:hypothetical protein